MSIQVTTTNEVILKWKVPSNWSGNAEELVAVIRPTFKLGGPLNPAALPVASPVKLVAVVIPKFNSGVPVKLAACPVPSPIKLDPVTIPTSKSGLPVKLVTTPPVPLKVAVITPVAFIPGKLILPLGATNWAFGSDIL